MTTPFRVYSAEDLAALPVDTIGIRDDGTPWQATRHTDGRTVWLTPRHTTPYTATDVITDGPVTIHHVPGEVFPLPDLLTGTERFMTAAGQPIPDTPAPPPARTLAARLLMLAEEVAELCGTYNLALYHLDDFQRTARLNPDRAAHELADEIEACRENGSNEEGAEPAEMVDAVDAFLDIAVVAYGGALEVAGIAAARRAADEVTRSNLAKIGPDGAVAKREDGKVMKPAGWTPPDIAGALGISPVVCPRCGGQNGNHVHVHRRHPEGGGGSNLPRPFTPAPNLTQKEN